ncbi:MAG: hypothetical protein LBU83_01010 [Bacteroidales bacterium]|nr:hypothetical protein [Bacteroidales bacterium]
MNTVVRSQKLEVRSYRFFRLFGKKIVGLLFLLIFNSSLFGAISYRSSCNQQGLQRWNSKH